MGEFNKSKIIEITTWSLVGVGAALIVVYVILISCNGYLFSQYPFSPSISGQIGDFLGGVIGTIWSLAAVLLLYLTLIEQKKELSDTRKEMHHDRFSLLVFNQLDNIIKIISSFSVTNGRGTFTGSSALDEICEPLGMTGYEMWSDDNQENEALERKVNSAIRHINMYEEELHQFSLELSHATKAMNIIYNMSSIEKDYKVGLEKVVSVNIGWNFFWNCEKIVNTMKLWIDEDQKMDFKEHPEQLPLYSSYFEAILTLSRKIDEVPPAH